jgi:hypothetical protein
MFKDELDAEKAVKDLNNRWFGERPIMAELSPVTDFREACCRQYEQSECTRGGFCNFMHIKPVSKSLSNLIDGACSDPSPCLIFILLLHSLLQSLHPSSASRLTNTRAHTHTHTRADVRKADRAHHFVAHFFVSLSQGRRAAEAEVPLGSAALAVVGVGLEEVVGGGVVVVVDLVVGGVVAGTTGVGATGGTAVVAVVVGTAVEGTTVTVTVVVVVVDTTTVTGAVVGTVIAATTATEVTIAVDARTTGAAVAGTSEQSTGVTDVTDLIKTCHAALLACLNSPFKKKSLVVAFMLCAVDISCFCLKSARTDRVVLHAAETK